jgi:hypothetical protein
MEKAKFLRKKGFRYSCSSETIEKYLKLPARMKLQWLEDINRFSFYATPRKNRRIWEQFREGKI